MNDIQDILTVEKIDADIYRAKVAHTSRGRTFGGQVAAQALSAAIRTVDEAKPVHSLHGYFLRPGDPHQPIILQVDRLRDGRSFTTRAVRAVQEGETIFSMQASFHIRDDVGPEHSDIMREVPPPEEVAPVDAASFYGSAALLKEWDGWDLRVVDRDDYEHNKYAASQQVVWGRWKNPLPDDDNVHALALAYMSDMTLLYSAMVPHPGHEVQMASLDHAMWFLRPFRADDWLLYDQISPSASHARGLTQGRIFNRQGDLVAMVTQEGLIRTLRQ